MKILSETINCKEFDKFSKRQKLFTTIKYSFSYLSDKDDRMLIDEIIKKGEILAQKVNKGAANNSIFGRSLKTVKNNAIAGLLAEYVWKDYLKSNNINVTETEFNDASNQIDLLLVDKGKTIEVRSSFPRNGIKFAVCHNRYEFDIIGPYSNNYKPNEIQKDFYVRVLFPFQSFLLLDKIKQNNFDVYLVGGATWEMMSNNAIAIIKSLIPEDELNVERLSTMSNYRVVPYHSALDTVEIMKLMKK